MSQSSGAYNSLSELVPFQVGMAALPMDNHASKKRFNNISGGAALWVVGGQTPSVYQGIARFFSYIAQPSVQQHWHQNTGYLPLGVKGIYKQLVKASTHPSLPLALSELVRNDDSAPILRLGAENQIRAINDEALELIFAGIKSPQQAIDDAVVRANHALLRFVHNTSDQ